MQGYHGQHYRVQLFAVVSNFIMKCHFLHTGRKPACTAEKSVHILFFLKNTKQKQGK